MNHITRECLHEAAHLDRSIAERVAARLLIGKVWAMKGNRGRGKLIRAMQYLTATYDVARDAATEKAYWAARTAAWDARIAAYHARSAEWDAYAAATDNR